MANVKQEVVDELHRLSSERGGLTAEAIVEAAKRRDSVLHAYFEWDDTKAAERWRLIQASHLIRVCVKYEQVSDGSAVPVRVFVSLPADREKGGGVFRALDDVLVDDDLRSQLLIAARKDMASFAAKYRHLEEVAGVLTAIGDTEARLAFDEAPAKAS